MSASFILGLTGGVGCGKSVVSDYLLTVGVSVVDADVIAREVVMPGSHALREIEVHFGSYMLTDGQLNRSLLRKVIFENSNEKKWLESLLHPLIRTIIVNRLEHAEGAYCVLVSPLLFETGQHKLVHRVLLIDSNPADQVSRVVARDHTTPQLVEKMMIDQMDREKRSRQADDIIFNNKTVEHLLAEVYRLHAGYLKRVQQSRTAS